MLYEVITGVLSASVNLATERATLRVFPATVGVEALVSYNFV